MKAFRRGDHVELAKALLGRIGKRMGKPVIGDLGALHSYDSARGVWRPIESEAQSRIVQSFADSPCGDKGDPLKISAGDVSGATKLALARVAKPGFFTDAPVGIAFRNGFLRLTSSGFVLEPHSPESRCLFGLPFEYKEPDMSVWLGFLRALFRDDVDRDEKIDCLAEFFGGSLLGLATDYDKSVVAVGNGDEGKSTLAQIVVAAFPPGSITTIPPQLMGQEYRRADLAGKRLNVVNELPESTILDSESFKAIVSGDLIDARHIREAPFRFKPVAGHYFAANKLPGTRDQTRGFWRRFIVITFNRTFEGDPERDPLIGERIKAEHLPSVVWWLLKGAERLLQRGRYTLPSSHEAALAAWKLESDQVAEFLDACATPVTLRIGEDKGTLAQVVYMLYRQWSLMAGHRNLLSSKAFGARLRLLKVEPQHTRDGALYPIQCKLPG